MSVEELPLLDLFTRLREAGLPLGIDEYRLVLRALQGGFGVKDRPALNCLCRTLWVKSVDEEHLFQYHFEQAIPQSVISETVLAPSPSLLEQSETAPTLTPSEPTSLSEFFEPTPTPATSELTLTPESFESELELTTTMSDAAPPDVIMGMEDEVQVVKSVLQATSRDEEIPYSCFVLTAEYFPVTRRQMKQSWRYLRRMIREGPPTELDLEATVDQTGRQGILLEPLLVPRRVNRTELLLLIDQDGSMVPFHALSQRLAETALRGGRLGKTGIYYFHNCPLGYLYHDPNHQEAELLSEILPRLRSDRTAVLIFSDAGAARGGFNPERIDLTAAFLDQLKQQVRYMAWLNPMPRSRWYRSTASAIAHIIPMFEVNRQGLDTAIRVLRGRSA